jgi:hypothetical protein
LSKIHETNSKMVENPKKNQKMYRFGNFKVEVVGNSKSQIMESKTTIK